MRKNILIDAGFHVGSFASGFLAKNPDFFCYAFEPNDLLLEKNENVRERYKDRLVFSDEVIWVKETEMELTIGIKGMKASSVVPKKRGFSNRKLIKKTFDFSKWLERIVDKNDNVVIKMDIEGSEYHVLPKMIEDGTIHLVDKLIIEFHAHKMVEDDKYGEIHKQLEQFFSNNTNIELIIHTSWKDFEKKYYEDI